MRAMLFAVSVFAFASSLLAGEPRLVETPAELRFGDDQVEMVVDRATGEWRGLVDRGRGIDALGDDAHAGLDLCVGGRWLGDGGAQPVPKFAGPGLDLSGAWRFRVDPDDAGIKHKWAEADTSKWRTLQVPGAWEAQGITDRHAGTPNPTWQPYNGVAWYSREFGLTPALKGKDLKLYIGAVDDLDQVFVNGVLVGKTEEMVGRWYDSPRLYDVPERVLKQDGPHHVAVRVYDRGGEGGILKGPVWLGLKQDVERTAAEAQAAAQRGLAYVAHKFTRRGQSATLQVTSRWADWDLISNYTFIDAAIVREAEFVYHGPTPRDLVKVGPVQFWLRAVCVGDPADAGYTILSRYPPQTRLLSECVGPARAGGSSDTARSVMVRNDKLGLSLVTAFYSETEKARAEVQEGQGKIDIVHTLYAADRLRPGLRLAAGKQLIRLVRGSSTEALQAIQDFYKPLNVDLPADSPADAAKAVIYSAHPGGTIDSHFRDVGGFRSFAKMVPHVRSLGATTLWLMPFWHGYVYSPFDYYRLDERLGSPEDLKALTDHAHRLGMRVLGDLIPHGPRDELGFHKQHPDWICRDEDGNMIYWWGCLYCDYANPGWQQYMADHAAYWVKTCGLDGYRVDVASGGPPNWRPYGDNRPSYSGLYGGQQLLEAVRREIKKVNANSVLLPEASGTHLYRVAEYAYDWPFTFGVVAGHIQRQPIAAWVADARQYLEYQKYEFPARFNPMRFLENHDTIRARMRYGVGLHRALLAMCAFIKGVPFLYHEQEVGDEGYIRRVYAIRARFDELTLGKAHYTAIRAAPAGLMAFARTYRGRGAVVAINFTPEPIDAVIDVPLSRLGLDAKTKWGLFEAFQGRRLASPSGSATWPSAALGQVKLPIGPYEPAVVVARPVNELPENDGQPAPAEAPTAFDPRVSREGATVVIENGLYRAVVDGARGGLLAAFAPTGAKPGNLLREHALAEGRRKLFIGADPIDFSRANAKFHVEPREGGQALVVARGTVGHGASRPVFKYALSYEADRGPKLRFRCELEPLVDVGPAKSSLVMRLRFRPTTHWLAKTAEGPLLGECVFRHPSHTPFTGRYWHPVGEAFYQSGLYPLHPVEPSLGVFDEPSGCGVAIHFPVNGAQRPPAVSGKTQPRAAVLPGAVLPGPVSIVEDKAADSPREIGGPAAPAIVIHLWGARGPVRLRKGQKVRFDLDFEAIHSTTRTLWRRLNSPTPANGEVGWSAGSALYTLWNKHLRAVVCRSQGGALLSVSPRQGDARSLITDSRFYTDYGLYGQWRDPRGVMHDTSANSSRDPEPDTRLQTAAGRVQLDFTSFFRHPYGGGRSLLNPRMQYRVAYELQRDAALRIECAVRPMMVKPKAKAFLAHTVSLGAVDEWSVNDQAWCRLPGRDKVDRLWQSSEAGALPSALAVRDSATGRSVRFTGFEAGADVQNVFLHGGGDRATLFVAFLSGSPVDVQPVWREARYVIELGGPK